MARAKIDPDQLVVLKLLQIYDAVSCWTNETGKRLGVWFSRDFQANRNWDEVTNMAATSTQK